MAYNNYIDDLFWPNYCRGSCGFFNLRRNDDIVMIVIHKKSIILLRQYIEDSEYYMYRDFIIISLKKGTSPYFTFMEKLRDLDLLYYITVTAPDGMNYLSYYSDTGKIPNSEYANMIAEKKIITAEIKSLTIYKNITELNMFVGRHWVIPILKPELAEKYPYDRRAPRPKLNTMPPEVAEIMLYEKILGSRK